jgi:hypothetical protein
MGPREPRSTILSKEEEALIVAFRKHTLLSLDDCLYTLQATIPHLTRSSLHRCLQRHGINRLPETHGDKPAKRKFKSYPIGYFHLDIAEVRTEEGKLYLFVAIDRTSKFAYVELHEKADRRTATNFLKALIKAVLFRFAETTTFACLINHLLPFGLSMVQFVLSVQSWSARAVGRYPSPSLFLFARNEIARLGQFKRRRHPRPEDQKTVQKLHQKIETTIATLQCPCRRVIA